MILLFGLFLVEGFLCYSFGLSNSSESVCDTASLILLPVNFIVAVMYLGERYRNYKGALFIFCVLSLLLKCLLILWDFYGTAIFVLPNSHSDTEAYHRGAIWFARNYSKAIEDYSYIVGWIYKLFGVQRITAQYFNVLVSLLGIDLLERMMCKLELSERCRKIVLFLALFLPNYLIMASILLRECLISVLLCLSLYCFIIWWKDRNLLGLALAFVVSLAACWLHAGSISVALGYALILILTKRDETGRMKLNLSFRTLVYAVIFFIGFSYLFDVFSDSILRRFGGMAMEHIENYVEEHHLYDAGETRSSTFSAGFSGVTGVKGLIINSPIRLIYFLWVPMPWMFRGVGDIIAFFGSSLFYGGTALYAGWILLRKNVSGKALILGVLMIGLAGALVFGWGIDSAGSALRHREKFYFVFLLLFALLWQAKEDSSIEQGQKENE